MTTLSIGLSILLTIALLILLVPIAMKSQLKTDTPARKAIIGIAVFVPVFTMASYFSLGTPEFAEMATEQAPPPMTTLVDELELKLSQKPKDINGWLLLGRSYMVTENYTKAIHAFEKALTLEPNNLNAILPLADAFAITSGGNLTGRPYQLLLQAYDLEPKNEMTLWLLGMAEKQMGNKALAEKYWQTLYKQLPETSGDRTKVASLLASIGSKVTETSVVSKQSTIAIDDKTTIQGPATHAKISISIETPESVRNKIADSNVFIYAKQAQGMPMPIAARRYKGDQLPGQVVLSKDDELMPGRSLNQFTELVIGIKISNGDAMQTSTLFEKEQLISGQGTTNFIVNF
ncbi:MAG: tetratricopeptide repeat protein [Pseudomonadota bacterium]|nr:tetratricopeptide repeat protein [Pseudomonadota bacterium]